MKRNRTVLHLDDDPSILRLVAQELGRQNYDVSSLSDPSQVIRALLETNARVVLLDVDLPGCDGLEILKKIKGHDGAIQVIMCTGMVSMSTLLQSMRWGAEACVFKPIKNFDLLHEALEAAFAKIDHWWTALHELSELRPASEPAGRRG